MEDQGCKVTAHDLRPIQRPPHAGLHIVQGNISDEDSIRASIFNARDHFGPINILVANAGITDESHEYPIWKIPLELWKKTYDTNIQGTFLTIKHFLQAADDSQKQSGQELENLAIVVTGSETGKFGQAGRATSTTSTCDSNLTDTLRSYRVRFRESGTSIRPYSRCQE